MAIIRDGKDESQIGRRQPSGAPLRPFDEPQVPRPVVVGQTEVLEFVGVMQAVEIEVHAR